MAEQAIRAPFERHLEQMRAILLAWGLGEKEARRTAEVLGWADLHGVASHGISMLVEYDMRQRAGRLNMQAVPEIVRQTPVSLLVDGNGGMGQVAYSFAVDEAIERAGQSGIAVAVVRNSSHFGAVGYFTDLAARAGLVGMGATTAAGIRVAPTHGAEAKLGTDPWSFAAPSADADPFLLDMATTTVAYGKIRNKMNEGHEMPVGWGYDKEGQVSTDPLDVTQRGGFMSPLGGTPEGSSYKGFGLAMMVNILSSCLSGATLITDPLHTKKPKGFDIGHFFLALDPKLFREAGAFEADVATLSGAMRRTRPADPARPVMVAGDPQWQTARERRTMGVPIDKGLRAKLKKVAENAGVEWLLDSASDLRDSDVPAGQPTSRS